MDQEKHSGGVYSQKELTEYGNHLIDAGFNEYIDAKINPYTMNIMLFTSVQPVNQRLLHFLSTIFVLIF